MEDGATKIGGADIKTHRTAALSTQLASTWETLAALPSANGARDPMQQFTKKIALWTLTQKTMTVQPIQNMKSWQQQQPAVKLSTTG